MGLLDLLTKAKENYDRIREEQKKRSLLSQLGRAASAIVPDSVEQSLSRAFSPIISGAKETARQAAINTAASLPIVGPAISAARTVQQNAPLIKKALLSEPVQKFVQGNEAEAERLRSEGRPLAAALQPGFSGARGALELTGVPSIARALTGFGSQLVQDVTGASRNPENTNLASSIFNPNYKEVNVPRNLGAELLFGRGSFKTPFAEAQAGGELSSRLAQAGKPKTAAAALFGLPVLQALSVEPGFSPGKAGKEVAENIAKKEAFNAAEYIAEQTAKRTAAEVAGSPGIVQRIRNFGNVARQGIADATVPLTDPLMSFEKRTGSKIIPQKDVRLQIDRVLRADTLANQFIRDSGIEKVIQDVPDLGAFDQYLIARQSADVAKQGIKTGRDLGKDAALVQSLAPTYEPFAQKVTQYSHGLLDYVTQNGLIGREAADALKAKFPNYVPLNRVFSEVEQAIGEGVGKTTRGVANLSKQTVVQKLEGSARGIANPLQSLLEKTYDAFRQGERNKAANMLADYSHLEGNPFGLRAVKEAADAESGAYFTYLKNGVKQIVEAPPEIAAAAKSLKVQQMDTLLRVLAVPNRIFKAGTTGLNVPFVVANSVKDLWTSLNLSPSALNTVLNPVVFLKGLTSVVKLSRKDDVLFNAAMRDAALQTSFDIARNQANQTLKGIRAGRGVATKTLYTVTRPSEFLRAVEDIVGRSEELSRLIQYEGIGKKLLKEGASQDTARLLAADAARSTTANFARRGTWGNVLGAILPYFNSSVQGSRTLIRAMKERPGRTSAMIATSIFMPVSAATAWNLSDPKRKAAYDDIDEFEKENNIILVPPNPTQDEQGRWNVIKIPMPAGLSSLTIPVRKGVETMAGTGDVGFGDVVQGLLGAVSPINLDVSSGAPASEKFSRAVSNLVPQAIKPTVEAVTNTNLFTGRKQVPPSLENLPPELQVRDYTSGLARIVGNALNVSPIKTEEFVKGTFGQVGSQALNLADSLLAAKGVIPPSQVGGESIKENFLRRFSKAYGGTLESDAYANVQQYMDKEDVAAAQLKARAQQLDQELVGLSSEEANAKYQSIKASDPALAAKLDDVIQERKLGLSSVDKAVKSLGVKSGARAQYVYDQLQQLSSDEERKALWEDYVAKKIITDEVAAQLRTLIGK